MRLHNGFRKPRCPCMTEITSDTLAVRLGWVVSWKILASFPAATCTTLSLRLAGQTCGTVEGVASVCGWEGYSSGRLSCYQ